MKNFNLTYKPVDIKLYPYTVSIVHIHGDADAETQTKFYLETEAEVKLFLNDFTIAKKIIDDSYGDLSRKDRDAIEDLTWGDDLLIPDCVYDNGSNYAFLEIDSITHNDGKQTYEVEYD